jgi:hypothetical protein
MHSIWSVGLLIIPHCHVYNLLSVTVCRVRILTPIKNVKFCAYKTLH